jgi:NAD(P)-dependent dehydrogenase (short-subunit alcohol dehydrogenase family)
MAGEFANKVVLITGSSSGIGAATAVEFAKLGARVVINGRNGDKLKAVEQACSAATKHPLGKKSVLAVVADLSKDEDLKRLMDVTIREFGQLDVLVNNAGRGARSSICDSNAVAVFDEMLNLNLRSVYVLTHLAVPFLVKTKGNIINLSSIAGTKPFPNVGAYCVAKAGLDMLTQYLALEVGPHGIRVNCVQPGPVKTDFMAAMGMPEEIKKYYTEVEAQKWPLQRAAESEDIAHLIIFLASAKAVNMTGSCILNDGGTLWTMAGV